MDETISAFTELTIIASNDLLVIVDITDTTDGPNGTTKKIKQTNLVADRAPLNSPIFTGTVTIPTLVFGLVTLTVNGTELNYVQGVTSSIQTQLDSKQPLNTNLTTIGGLVDPNVDSILFWDDSASAYTYLTIGSGLQIVGTVLSAIGTGGGYTLLEITNGVADGDNRTFGMTQQPLFAIRGGNQMRVNKGWTWDGAHVVYDVAPSAGSDVYGLV